MATVRKSKKKMIIIPICIVLVIALIVGSVVVAKAKKGVETVSLTTIKTDSISETVSATGKVTSGAVREYKASSVATCKEVFVKVGDKVKKGDLLATFETENIDNQVSSLQSTYNASAKSYSQALANQKIANAKLKAINAQIPKLEKQLAKAKKEVAAMTTTKKSSGKSSSAAVYSGMAVLAEDGGNGEASTTSPSQSYDPTISGLVEAIADLVETINGLTQDIEETNALTRLIMETIMAELESGNFDSDEIAEAVGEAVAKAIEDGMVEFVDSGAAVEMIQAAVASVDWAAIGTGLGETNSVQLATTELQLASLYAQKELFETQADESMVNAQKQMRDSSKQALEAMKQSQAELQAGWKASMTGTVTECSLVAGAQTTLIETGLKIENMKDMVATISLGEYDIHKVKIGMPCTIKTAYGKYTGEVATIAPTATGGSESSILDSVGSMAGISGISSLTSTGAGVECTVTINEPDENIIIGFDAAVEIQTGEYEGIPVVPIESIVLEKEGTFVYLYDADEGTVTKTQITTGAISDNAYEITGGVTIGDQIISTPSAYEEDTFKVKVVNK